MKIGYFVAVGAALAAIGATAPAMAETPDQQYQDQLQRYQDQQQQYQYERDRYDRHLQAYEYNRAHPYTWWRTAYFHAVPDWYYRYRGGDLVGTEVAERDGRTVGHIGALERSPEGSIDRVQVVLGDNRAVWLDVQHVRFNGADHVAFVDLPEGELYDRANYRP
jgi:catechol 2,3-dioxygenase-like lactoylglutathione lyase family enzyme